MDKVEFELLKVARELAAASQARLLHTNARSQSLRSSFRQLRVQRAGQLDAHGRLDSYQPKAARPIIGAPTAG